MRVSVFLAPWGSAVCPEAIDQFVQASEQGHFDTLWIGDHIVFPLNVTSHYPYNQGHASPFEPRDPLFDSVSLTSYIAACTERIGIGISALVLPLRRPLDLAKSLASIDVLSRGRLRLSVGIGWLKEEFLALGSNYLNRASRTEEYLEALRTLWTNPESGYIGSTLNIPPVGLYPSPRRSMRILVGGNSGAAKERALRVGDGWHALRIPPNALGREVLTLQSMIRSSGRSGCGFEFITRDWLIASHDLQRPVPSVGAGALVEAARRRLADFESAGVDEFIIEFPGMNTALNAEWLEFLGACDLW